MSVIAFKVFENKIQSNKKYKEKVNIKQRVF